MEEFLAGILARFAYLVVKALIARLVAHHVRATAAKRGPGRRYGT